MTDQQLQPAPETPEQPAEETPPGTGIVQVRVAAEPMILHVDGALGISVSNQPNPEVPQVLLWDGIRECFIAVFLPPGSHWTLKPGLPTPTLWVPGMPGGPQ